MLNFNINFQKILIISSLSMVLSLIIVSSTSISYVKVVENQNRTLFAAPTTKEQEELPDVLKAGQVGEANTAGNNSNVGESAGSSQLPPIVFSTSGTITDIKSDRLIVKGDGSNFEDGVSRSLNVIFTSQTITFASQDQKNSYRGLDGLKHVKAGGMILIDATENIRGKVEFNAGNINLIK